MESQNPKGVIGPPLSGQRAYRVPFVGACLAGLPGDSARSWFQRLDETVDDVAAEQAETAGSETVRRTLAEALVQVESACLYAVRAVRGGDIAEAHLRTSTFKLVLTIAAAPPPRRRRRAYPGSFLADRSTARP